MKFSEKIYKLRTENMLSQKDLALKLNISEQDVLKWEQGMIPNKDDIAKIAEFFDCPIDCLINDEIILDERKKSSDVKINTSKKRKINLPDNWISTAMIGFSILTIIILWILSKIIKFPITHQDYQSGNFYVGFMGFIDYFKLELALYISVLFWVVGWSVETIRKVYLESRKLESKQRRKIIYLYFIRLGILILGAILFIYGMLNPWKFSLDIYSFFMVSVIVIIIVSLSIYIKYLNGKFK